MSALPKQKWSEAEYLAFERESETRHEFWQGEVYAMAGASPNHVRVTGNTFASLHAQLRQRPCEAFGSDLRIHIPVLGYFTHPDITVVCGIPRFTEHNPPSLLNPTLIVEVLSPSTENDDRGRKFQHYRALESLQEYLLVEQDAPRIERFQRQPDGAWLLTDAVGLDAVLHLASVPCTLGLADVYAKVTFEPPEPPQDAAAPDTPPE